MARLTIKKYKNNNDKSAAYGKTYRFRGKILKNISLTLTVWCFGSLVLLDCYLRGSIAVLLEGGVLVGVGFVTIIQFVDNGTTKHSFALSVDEHNLLAFMVLVLGQRTVDDVELVAEDVGGAHA